MSGVAISLCEAEEIPYLKDIQKLIGKTIPEVKDHAYPMSKSNLALLADRPGKAAPAKQAPKAKTNPARKPKSEWFTQGKQGSGNGGAGGAAKSPSGSSYAGNGAKSPSGKSYAGSGTSGSSRPVSEHGKAASASSSGSRYNGRPGERSQGRPGGAPGKSMGGRPSSKPTAKAGRSQ
ncbi:hypothetical protein KC345_g11302 [Hortaea werneckii]|nr:hypothetical protein KC345_g11302 [Hortaea werneckii]